MRPSEQNLLLTVGNYQIDQSKLLGQGASASVFQAVHTLNGQKLAVKVIDHSTITNEVTQYLLDGEIKAHKTLDSPYIIKTYDVIQNGNCTYIFMEQCPSGTLKSYIQNSPGHCLPEEQAIEILQKIVTGYTKIIDSLLIHRDLKTANILMRENGDPVIIDFGYCQMIMGKRPMIQYNVGSPSYMSPEAYSKSRYSQKSDVWALGVIYYEMIKGRVLDDGMNIKQFFNTIEREGKIRMNYDGMNQVSREIFDYAFRVNPEERGTSHKIKYLIDKSMISIMQARLNKKSSHSSSNYSSSSRNQPKMVSQGHIINNPKPPSIVMGEYNMRSSISVKQKPSLPAEQNYQHRNNQNSTVVYHKTMVPPKPVFGNNMPPQFNLNVGQRRTIDRSMIPPPSIKRIVSVREISENESKFLKKNNPVLYRASSHQNPSTSSNNVPMSLRII